MRSILEYQHEYFLNKNIIINESFKSSILREISDQLNARIKKHKEEDEGKESWRKNGDYSSNFKNVFSSYNSIEWDKITDDMFKEYSIDDEDGIKQVKRICSNRSNSYPGMIILINNGYDGEDKDIPKYLGVMISNGWGNNYYSLISSWRISSKNFKPGEAVDFLTKKFLLIDLTNLSASQKQNDRRTAKYGAFMPADEEERNNIYKKIADENKARYRQYLAKVKADRDSNDGMAEKVNEYANKALNYVLKASTNPIKYAKVEWDIKTLLEIIHDEKRWVNHNNRGGGSYAGQDGLLTVYKSYISAKLNKAGGHSYDYQDKGYEATKKKLNEIFQKIDDQISKIESKL